MQKVTEKVNPLVSVIIPCFNHGKFLPDAVASVRSQNYAATEIIIIDDGSTDNTQQIAQKLTGVKYIHQKNQGLSSARNNGVRQSAGEYLVFLDADDWLLPNAISINLTFLQQDASLAFVSGAHEKVFVETGEKVLTSQIINENHYWYFLQGNYIGMHATVMYRRSVFESFKFDETLKACEDYDLYLKIARKFPILHHTQEIAAYRIHNTNMSGNIPMMLDAVLSVLTRQKESLYNTSERAAYKKGHKIWKDYYGDLIYKRLLQKGKNLPRALYFKTLATHTPKLAIKYMLQNNQGIKSAIKKVVPPVGKKWLGKIGVYKKFVPPVGTVNAGDLKRTNPFSTQFGYDRGGPVDRYYIENFLGNEAAVIKGRVLEVGDNEYSLFYGGSKITQSDILHVHEQNSKATIIGDLSNAPQIEDNIFDCIVLTQTLHLIYDFKAALTTCHRILKPGGVLLLTAPGITPIDHDEWKNTWFWSFTRFSLSKLMEESFPAGHVTVTAHGNVYVASAFLYGMGVKEVSKETLDYYDEHFPVIITVKVVKAPIT